MHDPNCLFCKIVAGEIPCRKAHEDGDVLAFHDIRPLAPVHVLVIPKKHIATMYDCAPGDEAVLGRMLALAPAIARCSGSDVSAYFFATSGRISSISIRA